MFIYIIFIYQKNTLKLNIPSSDLAKTGSSSLQSHIAYTQNIRKIQQLKQSAGGKGGYLSQDI